MNEFFFDGLSPEIRTILDDRFLRELTPLNESELDRFRVQIQFDRDMTTNINVFNRLVEAVMTKPEFQIERSKSDGWLAPRIHNALRLTRREAARKEFWIGLIFKNLEYLHWRFEVGTKKSIGRDRLMGADSRLAFAQIWWSAELLAEKDYSLAYKSAKSSDLGKYYQPLDLFHSKPLAIALCKESFEKERGSQFYSTNTKKVNLSITCFVRDDIAPSHAPDMKAIRSWIMEKPDIEMLLADDLILDLPFTSTDAPDRQEMQRFVEFIASQSENASGSD